MKHEIIEGEKNLRSKILLAIKIALKWHAKLLQFIKFPIFKSGAPINWLNKKSRIILNFQCQNKYKGCNWERLVGGVNDTDLIK